jgi:hypothetical protein
MVNLKKHKKGQSLPLNTIVIAILVIIVLLVIIVFFTSNVAKVGDQTGEQEEPKQDDVYDADYKVVDEKKYELCAEFNLSNKDEDDYNGRNYDDNWRHDAGYQCISRKVYSSKTPDNIIQLEKEIID